MKTEVNIAVPSRRSVGKRGTSYVLLALFALVGRALVLGCGRCDAADFSLQLDAAAGGGAVGRGRIGVDRCPVSASIAQSAGGAVDAGGGQRRAIRRHGGDAVAAARRRNHAAVGGTIGCAAGRGVFGVAWGKRMSPVTLIMAGLVVGLYSSAANGLLALFHYEYLQNLFLWSSGSLNQQDWQVTAGLLPRVILAWLLALLKLRPMTLLGVDDGVVRNLGLGLSLARLAALLLAIVLSAVLVNAVGIVGFVGLFAPLLARLLGARRLRHRLFLAPLIGALLLWLTD